jgi:hypothetical protein
MVTGLEVPALKALVDALLGLYKNAKKHRLKSNAGAALTEAIRELLLAPPNLNSAESKIAMAKAAGIINSDLMLAEDMLMKCKAVVKKAPAKRAVAKKVPAKKVAPKKILAKKVAVKKTKGIGKL